MSNRMKIKKKESKSISIIIDKPVVIPGETVLISAFVCEKEQKHIVGWAYVKRDGKEALLLHIQTSDDCQRRGVATGIVKGMQEDFDSIVTSWNSDGGKALMKSCGFREYSSPKGRGVLVWKR